MKNSHKMNKIQPIILSGGSGTRLWPMSRKSTPKQFIKFFGSRTLFQDSVLRVSTDAFDQPIIVTAEAFRFHVTEQMNELKIKAKNIILEPEGKNTAPAVLVAARMAFNQNPNKKILVISSDHYFENNGMLSELLTQEALLPGSSLVLFGITPSRPETGFGYIETGTKVPGTKAKNVKNFREKPVYDDAISMLNSGNYLWNAGIFYCSSNVLLSLAATFQPLMLSLIDKALSRSKTDLSFLRIDPQIWNKIHGISIDYALVEKAKNLVVLELETEWSDLGDWESLSLRALESGEKLDEHGNLLIGNAYQLGSEGCTIWSDDTNRVVATIGMKNSKVIVSDDAVLVVENSKTQQVKQLVDNLVAANMKQVLSHKRTPRKWGWFEELVNKASYSVRLVCLFSGETIQLQKHMTRQEQVSVLEGQLKVKVDDVTYNVSEGDLINIKTGQEHELVNDSADYATFLEIRIGDQFTENNRESDILNQHYT